MGKADGQSVKKAISRLLDCASSREIPDPASRSSKIRFDAKTHSCRVSLKLAILSPSSLARSGLTEHRPNSQAAVTNASNNENRRNSKNSQSRYNMTLCTKIDRDQVEGEHGDREGRS